MTGAVGEFLRMQSLTLEQLQLLAQALRGERGNPREQIAALDREVDALELRLEDRLLCALAHGSPDRGGEGEDDGTRLTLAMYKSLGDIERVGDYCVGAARDLEELGPLLSLHHRADFEALLGVLWRMAEGLAYALAERSLSGARQVIALDDDADALAEQLARANLTRALERPAGLESALRISRLARNLERMGDHLKNVARRLEAVPALA